MARGARGGGATKPPTIRDVAARAGTSIGTVSRVINGAPNVAPDIQARVTRAIAELGYRPSAAAQSLRTAASRLIACVMPELTNPIYATIVTAAEAALAEAGYTLVVASTEGRLERELRAVEALGRRRVDGLLAVPGEEDRPDLIAALGALGVPVVLVERELPLRGAARVCSDHAGGMRAAVGHLLGLGHRRIALIAGARDTLPVRERTAAFGAALEAAGIGTDPGLIWAEWMSADVGYRATRHLLALPDPPTAIIAAAQPILPGVLQALQEMRLRPPENLSLVSWGDGPLATLAEPPVTVVRFDAARMGAEAARLLLGLLAGRPASTPLVLPSELVPRASSGPLAQLRVSPR